MKQLSQKKLDQYLHRIGYSGPTLPSEALLRDLIWKHATTIPFEGLSVNLGDQVHVDKIEKIFKKIVTHQRGGWCYEMNGLFFYVLKALRFDTMLQLASVYENKWMPPSHSFLIVTLASKVFLVDVGFGNIGLVEPVELKGSRQIKTMKNGINYQLTEPARGEYVYSAGFNNRLSPQYRFSLPDYSLSLVDLVIHNESVSTKKESPFLKNVVVKITTAHGFRKLVNKKYTDYKKVNSKMVVMQSYIISTQDEYLLLLKEKFGIRLPSNIKSISLFQ